MLKPVIKTMGALFAALIFVAGALPSALSGEDPPPGGIDIHPGGPKEWARSMLGSAEWPTDNNELIGYHFDPDTISLLDGTTELSNTTRCEIIPMYSPVVVGLYRGEDDGYLATVHQEVRFQTADAKEMTVKFSVFPSIAELHWEFVSRHGRMMPGTYSYWEIAVHEPDITLSDVGDVCYIRDASFVRDPEDNVVRDPDWEANTREVYSFYHNILIDIEVDADSSFEAIPLLQAIIQDMEEQRVEADGDPELPDVTLTLGTETVQAADVNPVNAPTVSFTYTANWDGAACNRYQFLAERIDNKRWDENFEEVPDPDLPHTYRSDGTIFFDDEENPNQVEGLALPMNVGHYHVVMVAWGDNLLPEVIYKPLEVTEP